MADDCLKCCVCENTFHFFCVGQAERNFRKMSKVSKEKFKCAQCKTNNSPPPPPLRSGDQGKTQDTNINKERKNEDQIQEMKDFFETKFKHMENKMDEHAKELKTEFTKRLGVLETKLKEKDMVIEELESRIEELEIRSRICNVEIRGVPESRGEDVKAIVERIAEVIGCGEIREGDVQVAHRVFSRRSSGPKPIVAHLASRYMKNTWIAKYKQYKGSKNSTHILASELHNTFENTPVYLYEHITTKRKVLLSDTRAFAKQANLKYVWTKEGVIFVREEDRAKVYKITTAKQLEEVKNVFKNKVIGITEVIA